MDHDTRISISLSVEMHEKLNKMLPWGVKSQVLRELIATLIKAQEANQNHYIIQDLLEGKCSLSVDTNLSADTNSVQIVNKLS